MPLYNSIGFSYAETRRPDPRIVAALLALLALPEGSRIGDIGAGTGSYTTELAECGYEMIAVEPSSVMRSQAPPHPRVRWIGGVAESLPLRNGSLDGVVSTLAIHHFPDGRGSLREMDRAAGDGPLVVFTFDYTVIEMPWQANYFPALWEQMRQPLPPLTELAGWLAEDTGRQVEIVPFLLPADLSDLFMLAAWRRPHLYLDPQVRAGISTFALADPADVDAGIARLQSDLGSGRWDADYGRFREQSELDAGYRFLCAKKHPAGASPKAARD